MFERERLIQLKNVHFHWLYAKSIANNQAKNVFSLNNSSDDILLAMRESFERVKKTLNIDFIDISEQTIDIAMQQKHVE